MFVAGDHAEAKQTVVGILGEFGWAADSVLDLGDLIAARATELYLPIWVAMMQSLGTSDFNISISRA